MLVKQKIPSYTSLVVQVVRDSPEPISFKEIMSRVAAQRAIDTNSPKGTIRNALTQCRLIANTGDGRYGWYPRLITGSFVRIELIKSHIDRAEPCIILDNDVRELLWPSFFAIQSMKDREPVAVILPDGTTTEAPLDFFGAGVWATTGSPAFWDWIKKLDSLDRRFADYRGCGRRRSPLRGCLRIAGDA